MEKPAEQRDKSNEYDAKKVSAILDSLSALGQSNEKDDAIFQEIRAGYETLHDQDKEDK